MIFSHKDTFDWEAAITVTRLSTNTIDLKAIRDIGQADDLWLLGKVDTAFTAAGALTLAADLVDDDNEALASPATVFSLMPATGKATLVAGYVMFKTRIPLQKITQRYIGINWTIATGPATAGAVSAAFTPAVDAFKAYPRGYVAS